MAYTHERRSKCQIVKFSTNVIFQDIVAWLHVDIIEETWDLYIIPMYCWILTLPKVHFHWLLTQDHSPFWWFLLRFSDSHITVVVKCDHFHIFVTVEFMVGWNCHRWLSLAEVEKYMKISGEKLTYYYQLIKWNWLAFGFQLQTQIRWGPWFNRNMFKED